MSNKYKINLLFLAVFLSSCDNQYWTRNDSIHIGHGDAVESNMAAHIRDPSPKLSENTNIPMDPVKKRIAKNCYLLGQKPSDPLGELARDFSSGGSGGGKGDVTVYAGGGGGGGGGDAACKEIGPYLNGSEQAH
jgi:hypothetical protein